MNDPICRSNQLVQFSDGPQLRRLSAAEVTLKVLRLDEQRMTDLTQSGARICERCINPFDYKPRSQGEAERLHQSLFMTGAAANHVHFVCESCFDHILDPALRNDQVEVIGLSNSSPPNLVLARSAEART